MTNGFKDVNAKVDSVNTKVDKEIGNLATMVAKGFSEVHTEMNNRFDEVDKRFDKLEGIVHKLDTKVNEIDKRLKAVEKSLEPLSLGYRIMSKELQELNSRVFHLEKKIGVIK